MRRFGDDDDNHVHASFASQIGSNGTDDDDYDDDDE